MRKATDATDDLDLSVKGGAPSTAAGPDGPGGSVPPIGGEGTKTIKSKQVNLPNTVGRVFFTLPKANLADPKSWKYCSGSSVQGKYRNLVATSAHCVYDVKTNQFYDNWIFIPSYWDGDQAWDGKNPYGIYAAKWFNAHDDFVVKEDYDFDYAFVNVSSGFKVNWEKGADGKWKPLIKNVGQLGDNVGGQGFAWNQKVKSTVFSFGYPAKPAPRRGQALHRPHHEVVLRHDRRHAGRTEVQRPGARRLQVRVHRGRERRPLAAQVQELHPDRLPGRRQQHRLGHRQERPVRQDLLAVLQRGHPQGLHDRRQPLDQVTCSIGRL
ncbi:trypsin-like serine peptidase [Streptosporangium lutulentum]